jgi:hypothetical protein
MMSASASCAKENLTDGRLRSGALPMAHTNCAVQLKAAIRDPISGPIQERRSFPISSIQIGGT